MEKDNRPNHWPWPWVTKDSFEGREWVHYETLRFYVGQDKDTKLWSVTDRSWDLRQGKSYKRKHDAIRAFVRQMRKSNGLPPADWIRLTK